MSTYNLILKSIGWDPIIKLPQDVKSYSELKHKPFVACLSHTTFWEFPLWVLYRYSNDIFTKYPPVLLMSGKFVDSYPSITKRMNCVGIYKDKKNGKTNFQRVISEIKKLQTHLVILDPSGNATQAKPWRSGYYYIAKELGWDLRAIGFDFEKKQLIVSDPISSNLPKEQVESYLQHQMSYIIPRYPDNLIFDIQPHNQYKVSTISTPTIILWLLLLFIIFIIIIFLLC